MRKAVIIIILGLFIAIPFNVFAYSTNYRYTGKPFDVDTDLYNYGQRYYNPNVGQFTQPDPVANYLTDPQKLKQTTGQDLQKFLENPQALNTYSYTQNNPVRYTDPTGEYIDELADPMFITQSYKNMQSKQTTWSQIAFGADLALLVIPFFPAVMYKTGDLFEGIAKGIGDLSGSYKASRSLKIVESAIKNGKYIIEEKKILNYLLDSEKTGKAIVFEKYGYTKANYQELISDIQKNLSNGQVIEMGQNSFGKNYAIDINLTAKSGDSIVMRTGWFLDNGAKTPRLVTAYIK